MLHYYKTIEEQNETVSELKESKQNLEEEVVFYQEKETLNAEKIEKLEQAIISKDEELENERKKHSVGVRVISLIDNI